MLFRSVEWHSLESRIKELSTESHKLKSVVEFIGYEPSENVINLGKEYYALKQAYHTSQGLGKKKRRSLWKRKEAAFKKYMNAVDAEKMSQNYIYKVLKEVDETLRDLRKRQKENEN